MYRPWYTQCAQMLLSYVQHPACRRLSHKGDRLTVEARIHPNVLFDRQGERHWAGVFFIRWPVTGAVASPLLTAHSERLYRPTPNIFLELDTQCVGTCTLPPIRTRNSRPLQPAIPARILSKVLLVILVPIEGTPAETNRLPR
jgi:hypothetical protein